MPYFTEFDYLFDDEEEEFQKPSQKAAKKEKKREKDSIFPEFDDLPEVKKEPEIKVEEVEEPEKELGFVEKAKKTLSGFFKGIADFLVKPEETRKTYKEEFGVEVKNIPEEAHSYFDYHALSSIPAIQTRIQEIDIKQGRRAEAGQRESRLLSREREKLNELINLDNNSLKTVAKRNNALAKMSSKRQKKGVVAGVIDVANSFADAVTWLGRDIPGVEKTAKKVSEKTEQWANAVRPENPDFIDQLNQGIGSALTFFIPGVGVARGVTFLARVSPAMALFFGNVASSALESASEAGTVYDENIDKGKNKEEASNEAEKTFWANSVLILVTNKFGVFGESATKLKKILASSSLEGLQEYAQQIISNVNTGRPWDEGVVESGIIGAIIGGGLGSIGITEEQARDIVPEEEVQKAVEAKEDILDVVKEKKKPLEPISEEVKIKKELEPLAKEAKKYESAEEWVKAYNEKTKDFEFGDISKKENDAPDLVRQFTEYAQDPKLQKIYDEGGNDTDVLTSFYNQAVKKVEVKKPTPKEKPEKIITQSEKELVKVYKAKQQPTEEALGQVWQELEIAEAGQRIFLEGGEVKGIKSTFPTWVPDELRSRKLFDKVMEPLATILETGKYPAGTKTKQRELFDEILEEVDRRANIDTSKIRGAIIEAYGREAEVKKRKAPKAKKAVRRVPKRGKKPSVKKELGYSPSILKKPKSPKFQENVDKVVKQSEIARELSKKLNVPIRIGKFRRKVFGKKRLGIYKIRSEIIRYREGGFATISHEVGHFLQNTLTELSDGKISRFKKDLGRIVDVTEYGAGDSTEESFAEFVRLYLTEPNMAEKTAPQLYKYFEKTLDKYPLVKEPLIDARSDFSRWLNLPASAKVLSQISLEGIEESFKERILSSMDDLYTSAINDLAPISKFVELGKKLGVKVAAEENPYVLARNTRGWVGKADLFLTQGTFGKKFWRTRNGKTVPKFKGKAFRDILKPVEKRNATVDFITYLVSKRTVELHGRDISTGIEKADAKTAVKELEKKHKVFPKVAEALYQFQDEVLTYALESNIIDKVAFKKMRKLNRNYVPFFRVFEGLQEKGHMGRSFANVRSGIKKIKGSEREIVNPLESIIKNTYSLIYASERNNVGMMMARMAAKDKELARMFEEVPTPLSKVATVSIEELGLNDNETVEIKRMLSKEGRESLINIFRPSMYTYKDNSMTVMMKGKPKHFEVDPSLYRAMSAMDTENVGTIIKIFSLPARWLRAGATLAPEFMVRNPARDQMTAFVYSKYGFMPIVDLVKGTFSLLKKDADYKLWKAGGGEHSMLVSLDREYLQKSYEDIHANKRKKLKNVLKNPIEMLRVISELGEAGTRIGEAKKALSKGMSPQEAAFASRELTLDFARIGAKTKALNSMVAFWNASVQGTDKMIRSFKNDPVRTSFKTFVGITLPSILLYMANRDDPRWKEIPQWQKDLFWIILTDEHIYRIPKPFELGIIFGSVPERILEYMDTKDPGLFNSLYESIRNGAMPGLVPTAILPIMETESNYSFFLGRKIVPTRLEGLPPEAQFTQYTSETAKKLGKFAKYSPAKLDHIIRGFTANLGQHAIAAIDKILVGTGISPRITDPTKTLSDKPVIKAFVIRRPIGSASQSVTDFYDVMSNVTGNEKLMKKYIADGETKKLDKLKKEHPEVHFQYDWESEEFYSATARYYRKVSKTLSELRTKERAVYADKKMSADEKRKKITKIDELITKTAQDALKNKLSR